MVRRFGDKLAKFLLVVFNFIFLLCGIGIIVLSFGLPKSYNEFIEGLHNVNILVIVVGVFISIFAFLGCCGAISENKCMVTLFIILLTGILIGEIAVGGLAFAKRGDIGKAIKTAGDKVMNSTEKVAVDAITDIQSSLKCCGMDGPDDYPRLNKDIPKSCCAKQEDSCNKDSSDLYKDGCYKMIESKINSHLLWVGLAALFVIFVEVVGIIFACCLRGAIAERYESV